MLEIERKFMIASDAWKDLADAGTPIRQGYLSLGEPTVRVRLKGTKAYLTIKATKSPGVRHEFEYQIPVGEAETMLSTLILRPPIEKIRYCVPFAGHIWEIDIFEGANKGLQIAEVELQSRDERVDLPYWIGPEVSDDPRFFNAYLTHRPFAGWGVDYATLLKRV
ncbi:CYTH domain-containing protein [Govanella unica]|uniref:CYTH domain-containing protein n=1 Tax=Govanella unica TaxID=2975056 RepID=A0A9X3Z6K5_9PROT|nr:CYTH domain-containing protein [Govania unica]MDA5193187.1 CYTH domain-containing protein [Govania unica]